MSLRLVVVDDAPFIQEVVRHLAKKAGIEIVGEAANGAEAVEVVRRTRPDVVLMDIVMPIKSGIEATQDILKEFPDMKVVACSTADQESIVARALEVGCCDFVHKPFKGGDLLRALYEAVQSSPQSPVEDPS